MTISRLIRGDENNRAIIFVHGAGGSAATWMMQLRGLSEVFRVIALELNGHGNTPDRNPDNVKEAYLEDITEAVDESENPILAGHSMGGALAQLYALDHPNQLSGLVLIGTGAKLKVHPDVFAAIDSGIDEYLNLVENFMFSNETSDEVIEASLREVRQCPTHVIKRDFKMCDEFDIMELVENIDVPTLVLVGEDDVMTPTKYAKYLHDKMQNSELEIIPDAGHGVMVEQPSKMNTAIREWANRILALSD
ncbi:MAG: alpha/beta hydrolase [Candidatus Thorarchaeota archaeon]